MRDYEESPSRMMDDLDDLDDPTEASSDMNEWLLTFLMQLCKLTELSM
jgi:hypothetical protein